MLEKLRGKVVEEDRDSVDRGYTTMFYNKTASIQLLQQIAKPP